MTETHPPECRLNKPYYYTIKGIALTTLSLLLFINDTIDIPGIFVLTGLLYVVSGSSTLLFYNINKDNYKMSVWLILEGVAEFVLGIASILIVKDIELYVTLFASWALLYAFLQIIHIFELFNLRQRLNFAISTRAINGLLGGLAFLSVNKGFPNEWNIILIGVMILAAGIRIIFISLQLGSRQPVGRT